MRRNQFEQQILPFVHVQQLGRHGHPVSVLNRRKRWHPITIDVERIEVIIYVLEPRTDPAFHHPVVVLACEEYPNRSLVPGAHGCYLLLSNGPETFLLGQLIDDDVRNPTICKSTEVLDAFILVACRDHDEVGSVIENSFETIMLLEMDRDALAPELFEKIRTRPPLLDQDVHVMTG